jgi:hypothetical protein
MQRKDEVMFDHDDVGSDTSEVYARLREVLEPYVPGMQVMQANERGLYLNTNALMKNRQPLFFAAVMLTGDQVSFYVQAVEMYPDLLGDFAVLEPHLEGLSCFVFDAVSQVEIEALRGVLSAGLARFKAEGDI